MPRDPDPMTQYLVAGIDWLIEIWRALVAFIRG